MYVIFTNNFILNNAFRDRQFLIENSKNNDLFETHKFFADSSNYIKSRFLLSLFENKTIDYSINRIKSRFLLSLFENEAIDYSMNRIKLRFSSSLFEREIDDHTNDRIKSRSIFSSFENKDLNNLLNIKEFEKTKTKKRFKKSQNKKKTIIKIKKKTINFTKRNFSNFEFVKRDIALQIKQIKKTTKKINEIKKKIDKKKISIRIAQKRKARKIRKTQNETIKRIIKLATIISQIIHISNNKFNDNDFRNLVLNNDENFNAFEHKNKNANDN